MAEDLWSHVRLMKPTRVVDPEVRGSRRKMEQIATEIVREHAAEIARNSLLNCNTVDDKMVLTVTISLSNPQPDLALLEADRARNPE